MFRFDGEEDPEDAPAPRTASPIGRSRSYGALPAFQQPLSPVTSLVTGFSSMAVKSTPNTSSIRARRSLSQALGGLDLQVSRSPPKPSSAHKVSFTLPSVVIHDRIDEDSVTERSSRSSSSVSSPSLLLGHSQASTSPSSSTKLKRKFEDIDTTPPRSNSDASLSQARPSLSLSSPTLATPTPFHRAASRSMPDLSDYDREPERTKSLPFERHSKRPELEALSPDTVRSSPPRQLPSLPFLLLNSNLLC